MKSCGDCGSAYQEPRCRRLGTRKSRAPSGVERVRIGVSISRKPSLVEVVADRPARRRWRRIEVVAHALPAQVEVAVAQAELLAHRVVLVDLERRRLGVGEQLELGGDELHLAGRELGLTALSSRRTSSPLAVITSSRAQPPGRRVRLGRLLGPEDELEQPGAVAQVDEDQPAVVAAAVHPAGDAHLLAHVVRAQLAGPVVR